MPAVKTGAFFGLFSSELEFPIVEIASGSFMMGALPNDDEADEDEIPRHKVTLAQGFWMGKYPCTQELYKAVMGENPSEFKGSARPVEKISWCDAVLFCNKLSEMDGLEPVYVLPDGLEEACKNQSDDHDDTVKELSKQVQWNKKANGYRLPTEAEWEYCARAGQSFKYSGSNNIDVVGWYDGNSGDETHSVGQKKANGFGLYDMSGNVWEWVWDTAIEDEDWNFTGESKYTPTLRVDPIVDGTSTSRILRGGDRLWASNTRVSVRHSKSAAVRFGSIGFRFVRTTVEPTT